jgi:AAA15 family ATPase/GTPase
MKLKEFNYAEDLRTLGRNPWSIDGVVFQDQNLVVGMNSVGKTRLLNIIGNFARILAGKRQLSPGSWDVKFEHDGTVIHYQLKVAIDKSITEEKLSVSGKSKLSRTKTSTTLYSEKTKQDEEIKPPADKLVMQSRADEIEYPYLENIANWAANTVRFSFAEVNATSLVNVMNVPDSTDELLSNTGLQAAGLVLSDLGETEINNVLEDMKYIGYDLEGVSMSSNPELGLGIDIKMLNVKPEGQDLPIAQVELSTGLVRALSLLIVVEYIRSKERGVQKLVLIDDLDEGLDYDRANRLSKLVFEKLDLPYVQLIAATNSRVLMNGVDIEKWNILSREKGKVKSVNYTNKKEAFDKFRLTGLSNFDLFSSDYLEKS